MASFTKIEGILKDHESDIAAGRPFLIDLEVAKAIIDLIGQSFEFEEEDSGWDVTAFKAAMDYLSRGISREDRRGKLWCLVRRDRNIQRMRRDGHRVQNAPDTKQEQAVAATLDDETPFLMLLGQNGKSSDGWKDCPFWWPVLQIPRTTQTTVFASEMVDLE